MQRCLALALFSILCFPPSTYAGETLAGWRGNWTGRFPEADPPLHWERVSAFLKGLRCQAAKPKDDQPSGVSAQQGAFTEWLFIEPFQPEAGADTVWEAFQKAPAAWEPDPAAKVGGKAWTVLRVPGSVIDLSARYKIPFGEAPPRVAYAHTYVYSPAATQVRLRYMARGCSAYLNGVSIHRDKKQRHKPYALNKGWNRLLYRFEYPKAWDKLNLFCYPCFWGINLGLLAQTPYTPVTKNILWRTRLPDWSLATPVIVGNRLFVMAEPGDLICVDKESGKIRWIRSVTFYDVAKAKEAGGNPVFLEVDPLVEKLNALNQEFIRGGELSSEQWKERKSLYRGIIQGARRINRKQYSARQLHGNCLPTPVSDGKHVYVWKGNGIAACFDLEGKREWVNAVGVAHYQEHGFHSSPALVDGKLIVFREDLSALDARSGEVVWQVSKQTLWGEKTKCSRCYGDSPMQLRLGGKAFVWFSGRILAPVDGKVLASAASLCLRGATPVLAANHVFGVTREGDFRMATLPTSPTQPSFSYTSGLNLRTIPLETQRTAFHVSPLYHEGLVYIVDIMGRLNVIDAKAGVLVYRRDMGLGPEWGALVRNQGTCYASPVLAGKHICFFGVNGVSVVLKPGRKYQEVARNKIESIRGKSWAGDLAECFVSTPVVDADRIYLRGEKYMYCIGKNE